jgi:hypothetical protein
MFDYRKLWGDTNKLKIPKGWHIHHIDGNHSNNDPTNLNCVSPTMHWWAHWLRGDPVKIGEHFIQAANKAARKGGLANKGKSKSLEHKNKISKTITIHGQSEEIRKRKSLSMSGKNNPRFGKPAWNKGLDMNCKI